MIEIKKFMYMFSTVLLTFVLMVGLTFWGIVCIPKDAFSNTYINALQAKYDNLISTNEPKIIIVGGSSAGFGINESLLEERTGYPVVNMGLHAGLDELFETEITKANINKGDIVLLGYEYGYGRNLTFDKLGVDLVMMGIDSRIEMYRWIPLENLKEIFAYLFTFAEKKAVYKNNDTGTYSRSTFDEAGRMILPRESYTMEELKKNITKVGPVSEGFLVIEENAISYLKKYKEYVEKRGAKVYFISPPLLKEALEAELTSLDNLVEQEEQKIGIEYISNPRDYIFSSEYMFDTIYHCNTKGEQYRTELLAKDLEKVLNKQH